MSRYDKQIENRNFLSPTGFKFTLNRSPKVSFFCNSANIPALNLGVAVQPSYTTNVPIPGDKVEFDDLRLRFLIDENLENFRCSGGYFNEYHAECISEVTSIINIKYQTMSYYGLSKRELMDFINQEKPRGIDRVTPIGKTMDFSLNWDGYDLIHTLSRVVEIN